MKKRVLVVVLLFLMLFSVGCSKQTEEPVLNLEQCTLFEDNFDNADRWVFSDANGNPVVLGKDWSIVDESGNNVLKGINHNWANIGEENWKDYVFKAKIKVSKGGVHLNFKKNEGDRYFMGISGDGLYLNKNFNQGQKLATLLSLPERIELDKWHEVVINSNKNNIKIYLDGNLKMDYSDKEALNQGAIAFETLDDSIVYIDEVRVSSCLEEEPTPPTEQPLLEEKTASDQVAAPAEAGKEISNDFEFNLPPDSDTLGWVQTTGPLGGTVIRMIPHGGTIWASLYSGGIYELQKDDSWKQIGVGHGISEVRAFDIVPDPNDPSIAYVPETIACGAKTVDGGRNWHGLCKQMLKDIKANNFNSNTLALDPADAKTLYLPGHDHTQTSMFLVSKDGGEHWEKRFIFDKHHDFAHLFFFHAKMYLATVDDGVFVSSDKGKSWASFNNGLKDLTTARFVNFKDNLYLQGALLRYNVRTGGNLYHLAPDGLSWEKVPELEQVTGLGSDGNTLFVETRDPNPKLWISTDGNSFQDQASQGLPPDWVGEIVSFDSKIYVGAGGNGIFVSSDNGKNFEEFNRGLISVATREVHVNPADDNELYVGTWDRLGFYWSKNGGKGYKRVVADWLVLTMQPNPRDFSQLYLGGDSFFSGTVSGQFTEKNKPGSSMTFIKSIGIDPSNFNHVLAGVASQVAETPPGEGLWESKDGGDTWTRAQGIGDHAVYSILFNPINSNIVYASALGEGVFKSTDGGSHFTSLGRGDELKYTYRVAMSPTDPNILVAPSHLFFGQLSYEDQISGKYGGMFESRDGGTTWKEVTAGIRQYEGGEREEDFMGWLYNFGHMPNYEKVLIDPKNPDHLVVGHHGENVVETTDNGLTWKKAGASEMVPGGVHNYAYCLGTSSSFEKFYACTCGRGLFRGLMNKKGYISLSLTGDAVYTEEPEEHSQPHNAAEAREIILSGDYNHVH